MYAIRLVESHQYVFNILAFLWRCRIIRCHLNGVPLQGRVNGCIFMVDAPSRSCDFHGIGGMWMFHHFLPNIVCPLIPHGNLCHLIHRHIRFLDQGFPDRHLAITSSTPVVVSDLQAIFGIIGTITSINAIFEVGINICQYSCCSNRCDATRTEHISQKFGI